MDKVIISKGYNSLTGECSSELDTPPVSQIIDGVDVSGCERFISPTSECLKCETVYDENCKGKDCYYKQLQRLQAENKKLKYYLNKIREDELNSMDVEWDEYITECTSTEYTNVITFVELALGERDE